MRERGDFAPYRSLKFEVREPSCVDGQCKIRPTLSAVQFEVKEVHGTSPKVAEGERYVVNGEYSLPDGESYTLSLAVFHTAFGAGAHLLPGQGRFETSTEILELAEKHANEIGVVVGNDKTGEADIVRWIMLTE